MAVDVRTTISRFEAGMPHEVMRLPVSTVGLAGHWALGRNGRRFLAAAREKTPPAPHFTVLLNWDAGLGGRR